MQKRLSLIHRSELGGESLEDAFKGGAVSNGGTRHGTVNRRNGHQSTLNVVRDPLDELKT